MIKDSGLVCSQFSPITTSQLNTEIAIVLNGSYGNLLLFFELILSKKLPMVGVKLVIQPGIEKRLVMDVVMKMGDL